MCVQHASWCLIRPRANPATIVWLWVYGFAAFNQMKHPCFCCGYRRGLGRIGKTSSAPRLHIKVVSSQTTRRIQEHDLFCNDIHGIPKSMFLFYATQRKLAYRCVYEQNSAAPVSASGISSTNQSPTVADAGKVSIVNGTLSTLGLKQVRRAVILLMALFALTQKSTRKRLSMS